MLHVTQPAFLNLEGFSPEKLKAAKSFLKYHDKAVDFEIQRLKRLTWLKRKDPVEFKERLEELKSQQTKCLLFEDEFGNAKTYSGLAELLLQRFKDEELKSSIHYPEPKGIPWKKRPVHESRYYQEEAKGELLKIRHGSVSMGTGLGKSRIILEICQYFGLKTIVMAPSISIASQLFADFKEAFGERYVGMFGDGKKKYDKLITIGIGASLTRVEPGSEVWKELSKAQLFIVDESHQTPADTLEKVCMGLVAEAPYRFFFSATQTRNDGSELVLQGIIGPVVYNMTVKQGVDEGFLAEPCTTMFRVPSKDSYFNQDAKMMTRAHFYANPHIARKVGELTQLVTNKLDQQVLILITEVGHFGLLRNSLPSDVQFAHGPLTKENKREIPEDYWESDPQGLVKRFNNEEFSVLVGTSCIGTGTDVKTAETLFYLQGGCSSIAVPQGVGRGTRIHTFRDGSKKTHVNVIDFIPHLRYDDPDILVDDYSDQMDRWSVVKRHAMARKRMYEDIYPDVRIVE